MADLVICEKQELVDIADAIRDKANATSNLTFPIGFIEMINNINTAGEVSELKFSSGVLTFSSDYSLTTSTAGTDVTHNLGIVPDAIFIRPTTKSLSGIVVLGYYFGNRAGGIFNPDGNLSTSFITSGATELSGTPMS